jgi:hypothetical protein
MVWWILGMPWRHWRWQIWFHAITSNTEENPGQKPQRKTPIVHDTIKFRAFLIAGRSIHFTPNTPRDTVRPMSPLTSSTPSLNLPPSAVGLCASCQSWQTAFKSLWCKHFGDANTLEIDREQEDSISKRHAILKEGWSRKECLQAMWYKSAVMGPNNVNEHEVQILKKRVLPLSSTVK